MCVQDYVDHTTCELMGGVSSAATTSLRFAGIFTAHGQLVIRLLYVCPFVGLCVHTYHVCNNNIMSHTLLPCDLTRQLAYYYFE